MSCRTWCACLALLLTACGDGGEAGEGEGEGPVTVDASTCSSQQMWAGGNEESPLMHPGLDCIGCHEAEHEGPRFVFAGTVFSEYDALDDCFGVEGAVVELTDANDVAISATTNAAGNFYLQSQSGMAAPYTARVMYDGRERAMDTPQTSGACATCHTESGANGAPGRILAP